MWLPTLSLGSGEYYALLAMRSLRCCLGAVDQTVTCQAGLWEVLSPGRLPLLRSLVFRWQQQSSVAAQVVCYGQLSSAARGSSGALWPGTVRALSFWSFSASMTGVVV